jgi:hypothetical protein
MIVNGNERVLFIKRGENFQPVGCLTSNGMDEDTEMLPTTTRNAEGWRTSIPQLQGFTINFEGLQVPTIFQANSDVIFFSTMIISVLNNDYNYLVSDEAPTIATYILDVVEMQNPNQLVSYDRLRQIKRNREKITWRIFSPEIGTQFIDEGEGFIANISESSPVNNDASFSGSIMGWGVPRVLLLNVAIGTNGEFITDGEDNIISP